MRRLTTFFSFSDFYRLRSRLRTSRIISIPLVFSWRQRERMGDPQEERRAGGVHPPIEWRSIRGVLGCSGLESSARDIWQKRGWYPSTFQGSFELWRTEPSAAVPTKRTPVESSWGQGSFADARRSLTDVLLCQLKKRFMNFSGFPAPLIPFTRSSSLARDPDDPSTPLQTCFEIWSKAQNVGSQRNTALLFMHFTRGTPFSREVQIKE